MIDPMTEEYRPALQAAWSFWYALAADEDDVALLARLSPDACAHREEVASGSVAEDVRGFLQIERATIGLLGAYSKIELYAGPIVRIRFAPTGPIGTRLEPGATVEFWRLDLELHDGQWLVHPLRRDRGPMVGMIELRSTPGDDRRLPN